jgi:hypothetical protein
MILIVARRSFITVLVFALFTYVYSFGSGLSSQAGLFPLMIGLAGMVLSGFQLLKELKESYKDIQHLRSGAGPLEKKVKDTTGAVDFEISEEEETKVGRIRALEQFGWLFGMLGGLYLFGFYITLPLVVVLYTLRYREKWWLSLLLGAGLWFVVWAMFSNLLNLPFPKGVALVFFGL